MSFVSRSFVSDDGDSRPHRWKPDEVLQKYLKWLDDEPLQARCVTGAIVGACGSLLGSRTVTDKTRKGSAIDWLGVMSFALHGGLVAGPLSHYLNEFMEENFFGAQSQTVLFDQIIAQPPQLFLMFAFVDVARTAISSIPVALSHSSAELWGAVAHSWKFWPVAVYVLLKSLKKRRHYVAAMNLCSIAWVAHLAKRRSRSTH